MKLTKDEWRLVCDVIEKLYRVVRARDWEEVRRMAHSE